jgi:RNA polymerase primary sigma factor
VTATEAGDHDASRELVEMFLPAIAALSRRFPTGFGVERRELIQEGVVGLLFAARRYDPEMHTPFWAYASFWVRKAMQELVAQLTRPVALSDRAARALGEIRMARREHLRVLGAEPTDAELSVATGLRPTQVESLQATERRALSMEEHPARLGDSDATLGETIVDPLAERAFDEVLDGIEVAEVHELAERLDGRERDVIRAHYGLTGPARTLEQIGGSLGLTAERASQIEVGALGRLRAALERPDLGRSVRERAPQPLERSEQAVGGKREGRHRADLA